MRKSIFFSTMVIFFFSSTLNAHVLYQNRDDANFDFKKTPASELYILVSKKDIRSRYLFAMHNVHTTGLLQVQGAAELKELASKNIADASFSLYKIASWAKLANISKKQAVQYLEMSAKDGYPEAQIELATFYRDGVVFEKSLEKYHFWIEQAAQQKNLLGMQNLASNYFLGKGVDRDDQKGFFWLLNLYSIAGRDFNAWRMLAAAYEEGRGTSVDLAKAYMCFDLMGTAGIEEKARIAPRMTAAQRAEGLRLSQEWQQKNHVYTMQSLGLKRQKDGSYQ